MGKNQYGRRKARRWAGYENRREKELEAQQSSVAVMEAPEPMPEPIAPAALPLLSSEGVNFIIKWECGTPDYYERFLAKPTWPKGQSGVTIGCGYDLGYENETDFQDEWSEYLAPADFKLLKGCLGLKGRDALYKCASLPRIYIPYQVAVRQFKDHTLPRYYDMTLDTFGENFETLPDLCQVALVSLVFNRGANCDSSNPKRREMADIQRMIKSAHYDGIAQQIFAMRRLWADDSTSDGDLADRRKAESELFKRGLTA